MLRFAVYDERGPASEWPLINAHLLGPDDTPARGEVVFRNGMIECRRRVGPSGAPISGSEPSALCLQHDAGPLGQLMLQTAMLPPREEPYVLSVELARHRVKMFIAKSEEWQMFDLSAEHPAMQLWEEARRLSSQAWISKDPLAADRAARKSLIYAIDATERLAMAHAEILLHRRFGTKPAAPSTLGIQVWPGRDAQPLRELVKNEFDLLDLPLNWKELEVKEGVYDWDPLDRWMEWATKNGKPIVAGPLLDFSKRSLPKWMYVWQNDYDTCRDMAYDHIDKIVSRYQSHVSVWNIGRGLNVNDNFVFTPEQMLDLTRMAVLRVRQHNKKARAMMELSQPFSEHAAFNRDAMPGLAFIERLVQEGVRLDAVGLQVLFGGGGVGGGTRDLMQVSSLIDRFFLLEIPILISAFGVPSEPIDERAGTWREPWSAELQSKWISRLFAVALSKPFVESIFWAELFDHPGAELPKSGLITEGGQAKPALQRLVSLRRHLRKPLGPLKLPTKQPGTAPAAEEA